VITGSQIRAARALLNWQSEGLSKKAGITRQTLHRLESFDDIPPSRTQSLVELQRVFEEAGIEFIDAEDNKGPGVRLARWPTE
jgi:hypothetical protein